MKSFVVSALLTGQYNKTRNFGSTALEKCRQQCNGIGGHLPGSNRRMQGVTKTYNTNGTGKTQYHILKKQTHVYSHHLKIISYNTFFIKTILEI